MKTISNSPPAGIAVRISIAEANINTVSTNRLHAGVAFSTADSPSLHLQTKYSSNSKLVLDSIGRQKERQSSVIQTI
jgi:hypothetical protein